MEDELMRKLTILADSAKYDVACTSSGASRGGAEGQLGSCYAPGCCHSFTADGRCVSLLKILMTNICAFDCCYCVNRSSSDVPRACFTPREIAELTIQFYRRNYIEGLFLSSAVLVDPDHTTERMIAALRLLREEYGFRGYIHAKAIPGTDPILIRQLGLLSDRLSVNIELPSEQSLQLLAPDKHKQAILRPMGQIARESGAQGRELALRQGHTRFAPAGQSTQMIIGATPENDCRILRLTEGLYQKYGLKRVFFSAYIPVSGDSRLPAPVTRPPLLREHRLYQADWMLRFYGYRADEILDDAAPDLDPYLDPKCNWALKHPEFFPVDVNTASKQALLRVPGIGPRSAARICIARQTGALDTAALKRIGVVLKRAQYFIECSGYTPCAAVGRGEAGRQRLIARLLDPNVFAEGEQLSMFTAPAVVQLAEGGLTPAKASAQVREEVTECLSKAM